VCALVIHTLAYTLLKFLVQAASVEYSRVASGVGAVDGCDDSGVGAVDGCDDNGDGCDGGLGGVDNHNNVVVMMMLVVSVVLTVMIMVLLVLMVVLFKYPVCSNTSGAM
jgi:hypothetical protein